MDFFVASALGVKPWTTVWLSDDNITKIRFKHPEITYQEYLKIPEILAYGVLMASRKARSVRFLYCETQADAISVKYACLKATKDGRVFLTNLQVVDSKEAGRLYRQAVKNGWLLRHPENELTRHWFSRVRIA